MRVLDPLNIPLKKLKPSGLRSGAGAKNVPHIQSRPRLPDINYGAVAAAGRSSRPQPGLVGAPGFNQQLPTPKTVDPAYNARAREDAIAAHQAKIFKQAKAKGQKLYPEALPATQEEIQRVKTEHAAQAKALEAGVLPGNLPITRMTGLAGWGQKLATEIGSTAVGIGPGMYHLTGGMIHHPGPTSAALVKAIGHSYGQTIHDPGGQLKNDPLGFITNVLTPFFAGSGAVARAAELGKTADALRAGEITNAQAVAQVGKTLMRPQPQERKLTFGGNDTGGPTIKLFHGGPKTLEGGKLKGNRTRGWDFNGGGGLYATNAKKVADIYAEMNKEPWTHELNVPAKMITRAEDPVTPSMRKVLRPIMGPLPKDAKVRDIFARLENQPSEGYKGLVKPVGGEKPIDRAAVHSALSSIGIHGVEYAPETTSEDLANLHDVLGQDPNGPEAKAGYDQLAKSREYMLWNHEKLLEHGKPAIRVPAPAFKSAFGGYMQTKVLDPFTMKAVKNLGAKTRGRITAVGREFKAPGVLQGMLPEGKLGKLLRRDFERQVRMRRGLEEVKITKQMEPGRGVPPTAKLGEEGVTAGGRYYPPLSGNPEMDKIISHGVPEGTLTINEEKGILKDPKLLAQSHKVLTKHVSEMGKILRGSGVTDKDLHEYLTNAEAEIAKGSTKFSPTEAMTHLDDLVDESGFVDKHLQVALQGVWNDMSDAIDGITRPNIGRLPPSTPPTEPYVAPGKLHGMSPAEAQKLAFGRGGAKAHHDLWNHLYEGGAGFDETMAHDPNGYVGIRKPPDKIKAKGYASEAGLGRSFKKMVEMDPKKLMADPHAYSYIPKGTWQRLKLFEPGTGSAAKFLDVVDRGTQMIRIGRFLHPGYLAWAVQNGILHASQAGMFMFRNAWQLRHEFPRMTPEEQAVFDNAGGAGHFGGGIARASAGSETSKFAGASKKLATFWHAVDDRYWRRMSLIHELNHAGYHNAEDWADLMKNDNAKFRTIASKGEDQAINYAEMSPSERATLQKVFTAWGWTRGASSYTLRFPFEHPIQARAGIAVGQEGKKQVDQFYAGKNGMVPSWLRGYLPLGHGNHPAMLQGGILNPAETLGNLLEEIPGATHAQTEALSQEEAPVPTMIQELLQGRDRYGNALKGSAHVTQPLADLAHRFGPFSTLSNLRTSKKGGGTFKQGPMSALDQFLGIPISHLNDAKKTAALGMKDYEQSLSRPDEINFRYHMSVENLTREGTLYHSRTGNVLSHALIGKIKGDLDAVHTRDLYQYQYAKSHGANSYRSLPAVDRVQGAISFMSEHGYLSKFEAGRVLATAQRLKDDAQLSSLANELWADTGIGSVANEWKTTVKDLQKPTYTPARG